MPTASPGSTTRASRIASRRSKQSCAAGNRAGARILEAASRIFPFNAASRALCRACGFREVGVYEKHGQLDGQWLDVVIVECLIPENLSRGLTDTAATHLASQE